MQTKSNIQLIRENLAVRDTFKANLERFMNEWLVEDSYFTPSKKVLGEAEENVKGYFVFEHEYNDFNEAISNMDGNHTVRIINNKRFQIGRVYEKLSEAKGDRVIDITTGTAAIGTEENIINLNSYIRISSIKEQFEESCLYVTEDEQLKDVLKYTNVIFETSQLKNEFFDYLNLQARDYTVINCLSSNEIFEAALYEARGLVIFDNVCCCRNNDILEKVIEYKNSKMLVC